MRRRFEHLDFATVVAKENPVTEEFTRYPAWELDAALMLVNFERHNWPCDLSDVDGIKMIHQPTLLARHLDGSIEVFTMSAFGETRMPYKLIFDKINIKEWQKQK